MMADDPKPTRADNATHPEVDGHLRAALRHAPDAATPVPLLLRARIVAAAHRSAEAARQAHPWHRRLAQSLGTPWRLGGAGTVAAALLAATVLWVGRDERPGGAAPSMSPPPAPAPTTVADATSPAPSPAPPAPAPAAPFTPGPITPVPEASPARAHDRARAAPAALGEGPTASRADAQAERQTPTEAREPLAATTMARRGETPLAEPRSPVAQAPESRLPAAAAEAGHVAAPTAATPPAPPSTGTATGTAIGTTTAPAARDSLREAASAEGSGQGAADRGGSAPLASPPLAVTAPRAPAAAATRPPPPAPLAARPTRVPWVEAWQVAGTTWQWRTNEGEQGPLPSDWLPALAEATRGQWRPSSAAAAAAAGTLELALARDGQPVGRVVWTADAVIVCDLGARCESAPLDAAMQRVLRERLRR